MQAISFHLFDQSKDLRYMYSLGDLYNVLISQIYHQEFSYVSKAGLYDTFEEVVLETLEPTV